MGGEHDILLIDCENQYRMIMNDTAYALVCFLVKENGIRELSGCPLYADENQARSQMEQSIRDTIADYSSKATNDYPIHSIGAELWHELTVPGECTADGNKTWITWEICKVQLPCEKEGI